MNNEISLENEQVTFDNTKVIALQEFVSFHDDTDTEAHLPKQCIASGRTMTDMKQMSQTPLKLLVKDTIHIRVKNQTVPSHLYATRTWTTRKDYINTFC